MISPAAVTVVAAVLGGLGGPLLALPAYRLSVPGGSRASCSTCEHRLGWLTFGSIPGRCPSCRARLGPAPWLLAAIGAVVCAGLGWGFGARPEVVPLLLIGVLGVLLAAVDLAAERLPDVLVLPGLGAAVTGFGLIAAVTGWWGNWGRAVAAGLAYGGAYLVLALLPRGQLGLGDVKLAVLLGVCLGWFGWPVVLLGALLPWLVNAPAAVLVLLRRGTGSSLPFGPSMLVGAYLAVLAPVALR